MKNEKKPNLRKLNKAVGNLVTACMTEMVEGFERLKGENVPIGKPVEFFVTGDADDAPSGRLIIDWRGMLRYEIGVVREEGHIRIARFRVMYKEALNELQLPVG